MLDKGVGRHIHFSKHEIPNQVDYWDFSRLESLRTREVRQAEQSELRR